MNEDLKRFLKGIQSGINYIREDIEAICDETMLEYAQDALNDLTEAEERIKALIEKQDKTAFRSKVAYLTIGDLFFQIKFNKAV